MANKVKIVVFAVGISCSSLTALVGFYEGKRNSTYIDPVGIPTACYGHTGPDVQMGQTYTDDQCNKMLDKDMLKYWNLITRFVSVPMTDWQHAAFTSFIFNAGEWTFRKSSMYKLAMRGDWIGACKALLLYNKATDNRSGKLIVLPGLTKRRASEYALCVGQDVVLE